MIGRALILALTILVLIGAIARPASAQSTAFCNITSIEAQQLTNCVQITVKADGVLEIEDYWSVASSSGTQARYRFWNAKSQIGKSFIDVSKFPVSYLQVSIPEGAREGVGIELLVALYEASSMSVEKSSDQQSAIITVNSNRSITERTTKPISNGTSTTAKKMEIEASQGRVSVNAVKANLRGLLAQVSRKAGVSIVVDDSVRDREVSMSFAGLTADEALRTIASASGLALSQINGVTMVSDGVPADLATYHLSTTESFRMKSIRAQEASGLLPTFLYSFLHVNEAQNAIVVSAPNPMLDKIRADFTKIDLAPPQIMVEALAIEVSTTKDLEAGLGMSFWDTHTDVASDSKTGDIRYSTIGALPAEFNAKLKALISNGKARVRATPRMAAVNGGAANIFIGETKFIKVEVNSYGGKQERIQGVDVGVKLAVRPWTGGNGEITVSLSPEVSNISELERESGLPVLSTRRAETTVRVKDGETVMIGGLTQKQDYVTRSKVPILGDIPLLGALFQSRKTNSIETELVIFVTPHILTEQGRLQDGKKEGEIRERFK